MTHSVDTRHRISRAARVGSVRRRGSLTLTLASCTFLGLGTLLSPVAAQEASPAAGEVVDPTECLIEPLTDDYLLGLAATPEGDGSPAPEVAGSPAPFATPAGEPAGDAEVEAVTATVRELVACLNAADYRRVYALYTEAYLARNFVGQAAERVQATPEPSMAVTENALVGVHDVLLLDDGRLAARVELATGTEALPVTLYSVFAQVDDRWLIDEETVLETPGQADGATERATPEA